MPPQHPLLTKLNITPADKGKIFKDSSYIFTQHAMKGEFEGERHKVQIDQLNFDGGTKEIQWRKNSLLNK